MRTTNFYRCGGAVFFIVAFCVFLVPNDALAGTCTISSNITQTQSELVSCGGGSLTDLVVDDGYTLTLSEPITVANSVSVNGSGKITHVAEDVDGINITAGGNMLVTGSIDANAKGCDGGTDGPEYHGRGPDPDASYACATAKGGYGQGDHTSGSGGGYGGIGGDGSYRDGNYGLQYGNPLTPTYLGSGGGGQYGGAGGGLVRLDVGGTLTVNGSVSSDGETTYDGTDAGGSGGAVYVTASILAGSGTITAAGGNGDDGGWDGGGGGGGRVAVYFDTNSGFALTSITAKKGLTGPGPAGGNPGSAFILNRKTDDGIGDLRITSGIDFLSGDDFTRTSIIVDSGASLTCPSTVSTLSISATGDITDNGSTWTCSGAITTLNISAAGTLTTAGVSWDFSNTDQMNLSAATWASSGTNSIILDKAGAQADWDIANDLTLNNMTYTGGEGGTASSSGGVLQMDNVIDVALVNSSVNSSVDWQGLTALNIDSNSTVNATAKGCGAGVTSQEAGYGPNSGDSYKCALGAGGGADGGYSTGSGGGHGGNGGDGTNRSDTFGTAYGTSTAPIYLGSGGSAGGGPGGAGGGLVRLDIDGTLTVSGAIRANGKTATGNQGGGGSGGSVYITATTLAGSANITVDGGDGEDGSWDGGGGGAGRAAVYYGTNSGYDLSNITAVKGEHAGGAEDGEGGSTFILNRKTDDGIGDLRITSGIDFQNGDDFSRTNIIFDSGALLTCPETITTLNVSATGNITDNGSTWTCDGAITTLNISSVDTLTTAGVSWDFSNTDQMNLSAATWTSSGTNSITLDKAGAQADWDITNNLTLNNVTYTGGEGGAASSIGGVLQMDNVIDVALVNSSVNSSVDWQGLSALNIDSNSTVNATAKGCSAGVTSQQAGYGPDAGNGYKCALGAGGGADGGHSAGSGGGYGGNGGDGSYRSDTFGTTYGTSEEPIYLGSGGSAGGGSGGAGGGLVRLDINGTLTVSGAIRANGMTTTGNQGGGGSGGSVYISTITLAGTANITAAGGDGDDGSWDGGGGGGGRAAVYYGTNSGYNLSNITAVKGEHAGGAEDGDDGTVYTLQMLLLDYAKYKDINSDGQVDQVDLIFNKSIVLDECEASDYSFGGDDAGSITVASCAVSTNILGLTLNNTPAGDTSLLLTISYTKANGVADSIHDGVSSKLGDVVSRSLTDAAAPVLITLAPADDSGSAGVANNLIATFSELVDVETGNVTIKKISGDSLVETIDVTSGSVTGSGSSTITINPSANFSGSTGYYIQIDATAFDDANSNDFAGISDTTTWNFTVASTGGSVMYVPGTSVRLLTLTGGEMLIAGDIEAIEWSVVNYTSDVEIYFSSDAGAHYDLLDTVDTKSYDWIVPSVETSAAFVKVVLPDASIPTHDSSDYAFSIAVADESTEDADDEVLDPETPEEDEEEAGRLFDLPAESTSPHTGLTQGVAQGLEAGDMITGETTQVVYYLDEQGTRRPFPSLQIFLTWADSFDDVRLVSDATLSLIPLGAPMLLKPGRVLVKIPTVPHVYVVEASEDTDKVMIRHIPSEEVAIELFGEDWADYVIDVDLSLFSRFVLGEEVGETEYVAVEGMKRRVDLSITE
jgi:hypothetical protein